MCRLHLLCSYSTSVTGLLLSGTMRYLIGYYSEDIQIHTVPHHKRDLEDLCLLNPLNLCTLCDSAMRWSKTQSFESKKKMPSLIFIIPFEL